MSTSYSSPGAGEFYQPVPTIPSNESFYYQSQTQTSSFQSPPIPIPSFGLFPSNYVSHLGTGPVGQPRTPMDFDPESSHSKTQRQRRCCACACFDAPAFLLMFSTWVSLTLACGSALLATHGIGSNNDVIQVIQAKEALIFTNLGALLAAIFNEVFIDQIWRKISCAALKSKEANPSDRELAMRLRAANFQWDNTVFRLTSCRLSGTEIRAMLSYAALRWGTIGAIASVQQIVSFGNQAGSQASDTVSDTDQAYIQANRHLLAILAPVVIHLAAVVASLAFWAKPPWAALQGRRYDSTAFLDLYRPFRQRISVGSTATFEEVARCLEGRIKISKLSKKHKPGVQLWAKIKLIWWQLLLVQVPPGLCLAYFYLSRSHLLRPAWARSAVAFAFLAQYTFYVLAVDVIIWNLSLEGLSKTEKSKPNHNMRYLGSSSGTVLILRIFKQRRPWHAFWLFCLFWVQAVALRAYFVLYIWFTKASQWDKPDVANMTQSWPFWLGWLVFTTPVIFVPVLIWLFTPMQIPVCQQDGWRWSHLAQGGLYRPGAYGVDEAGRAVWVQQNVKSFRSWYESSQDKKLV